MKKLTLLLITSSLILTGCGIYKHSPIKDNPVNVKDRVAKNIEEGRGIRFGKKVHKVVSLTLPPQTNFGELQ